MTKKQLYIALLIIVAISIIAPWIWTSDIKEGLTLATTMLSGLCALATFYIAILLYDRYGMNATSNQRAIEDIEQLIAEMQKVNFVLCHYSKTEEGETPNDYIISLSFRSSKESAIENISPEALSSPLYYKKSGMYGCLLLSEKANNLVFLPSTIFQAVNKISVFEYSNTNIAKDLRPVTTLLAHSDKLSANHETLDVESTYIPKTSYSVIQFIDYYFDIRDAIVLWYKENGVDISQLNIEFR